MGIGAVGWAEFLSGPVDRSHVVLASRRTVLTYVLPTPDAHPAAILSPVEDRIVESRLREYFAKRPSDVVAAYLFGSFGRGTAGPESDVDVAVLYSRSLPSTLDSPALTQEGDLERILGRPSQVIALNGAPADLVHRVLRDGRLVFEGNRSARIAFEVKSRNEYFDLLPFLRRYRKLERPA